MLVMRDTPIFVWLFFVFFWLDNVVNVYTACCRPIPSMCTSAAPSRLNIFNYCKHSVYAVYISQFPFKCNFSFC